MADFEIKSLRIESEYNTHIFTDETFTLILTIKNTTKYSTSNISIAIPNPERPTVGVPICTPVNIVIASGKTSPEIRFVCKLPEAYVESLGTNQRIHSVSPFRLGVNCGGAYAVNAPFSSAGWSTPFTMVTKRLHPRFTAFSGRRENTNDNTPSDESDTVALIIEGKADAAMPYTIRFFADGTENVSMKLTGSSIVFSTAEDYTIMQAGANWKVTAIYGDEYEYVYGELTVPRAFANVHLSGATYTENGVKRQIGGVSFGKFSSVESTPDASGKGTGKFECVYPVYFLGGIRTINVVQYSDLEYADGFGVYEGQEARVSRVGCMVFLEGAITSTKASASSSNEILLATLPEWARPRVRVNQLMQGTSSSLWWLKIDTDGRVIAQRYRTSGSTSYTAIPNGAFLPISANWIAGDSYANDQ